MMRNLSLYFFILCIAISLAACTKNEDTLTLETDTSQDTQELQESDLNTISDWFELPDINIEPGVAEDVTKADVKTTSYLFHGRTEEENINLAYINEIAGLVLQHEYGYSPPKDNVITFIGEKKIWVDELSLEVETMVGGLKGRVIINPDVVDSVGALFYSASGNKLPAWLASGLELYWSDILGFERFTFDKDFDLKAWQIKMAVDPAFGDFYFRYTNDKGRLPAMFAFVKWLDENELLNQLVRAYLDDNQTEGDLLFADAWLKCTGYDIRRDFYFENQLRYLYGNYLETYNFDTRTEDYIGFTFSALTEHGCYFFDQWFWGDEDFADMTAMISGIDTQYAYAKQWLGFEDAAPIQTRMVFGLRGMSLGRPDYVVVVGNNPLVAVHEAIHHLLFANDIYADFLWFTEGLPEGIQYIYSNEDYEFYGSKMLSAFARGNVDAFIDEVSALYQKLTGKEYVYNGTFDFKQYIHIKALETVLEIGADAPHTELYSYETAASLVVYLLELRPKEDFMKLYSDYSSGKELYGNNPLYEQWLEFLTQRIF